MTTLATRHMERVKMTGFVSSLGAKRPHVLNLVQLFNPVFNIWTDGCWNVSQKLFPFRSSSFYLVFVFFSHV